MGKIINSICCKGAVVMDAQNVTCFKCGSPSFKKADGFYMCEYCGARYNGDMEIVPASGNAAKTSKNNPLARFFAVLMQMSLTVILLFIAYAAGFAAFICFLIFLWRCLI